MKFVIFHFLIFYIYASGPVIYVIYFDEPLGFGLNLGIGLCPIFVLSIHISPTLLIQSPVKTCRSFFHVLLYSRSRSRSLSVSVLFIPSDPSFVPNVSVAISSCFDRRVFTLCLLSVASCQ